MPIQDCNPQLYLPSYRFFLSVILCYRNRYSTYSSTRKLRLKFGLTLEQTLPSFEKPGPEALLLFGIRHTIKPMASKKREFILVIEEN